MSRHLARDIQIPLSYGIKSLRQAESDKLSIYLRFSKFQILTEERHYDDTPIQTYSNNRGESSGDFEKNKQTFKHFLILGDVVPNGCFDEF